MVPLMTIAQPHFGPRPPRPEDMTDEEFVKMQCNDMAKVLDLEGKQKKEFVAVYYDFRIQIDTLAKKAFRPCKGKDVSEDEIEKAILGNFELTERILQVRRDFYPKFKKVLKPSQIQRMYFVENNRGKHGMGGQPPCGGPGEGHHGGPEQMPPQD